MSNQLISVIIPIYNVEKYIGQCLNSIINQTYKNLEILCIDDCSTDNSVKVVEEIAKQDNRIKILINEKNAGQGHCRNVGINTASGEYIYFIDSDDFIDLDYIEKLYNAKGAADIVCNCKMLKFYGENSLKNKFIKKESEFVLNKKLNWDPNLLKKLPISPCCKLYKKELLEKFCENRLKFEDFYFLYILITKIKTITFVYNSTYYYRQRDDSTMYLNKYKKNDCFDAIYIINLIYENYKKNKLLNDFPIPFKWLNKYFKKINNKKEFFFLIKKYFEIMKKDIITDIYSKKDLQFFNCILNSNNYYLFRIKYFFKKFIN